MSSGTTLSALASAAIRLIAEGSPATSILAPGAPLSHMAAEANADRVPPGGHLARLDRIQVVVHRQEVVHVQAPAASGLGRDGPVRERLQAPVGRVPGGLPGPELLQSYGNRGVVVFHLDGLGHGTELPDHGVPERDGDLCLRDAYRHGVLLGCLPVAHEDTARPADVTTAPAGPAIDDVGEPA